MFDLDLFSYLSTLCIGTFCLFALIFIVYLSYRFFDIRKLNSEAFVNYLTTILRNELKQTGYTIFALICVFTLGVLTQDFTDHLADSEISRNPLVKFFKDKNVFCTEGEIRMESLVKNEKELSGLGKQIFKNKQLSGDMIRNSNNTFFKDDNVEDFWKNNGTAILNHKMKKKAFISYVNGIYYTCKNWCYLKSDPIRKELNEIQIRIDLARSLAIISLLTLFCVLTLYIVYIFVEFSKGKHKFKILETVNKGKEKKTVVKRKIFFPLKSIIILTLIFYVSRLCYHVAENNFNERAFGYYADHLKYEN